MYKRQGAGDIHLDVICSKLKSKFGVDVELSAPIVPYREKIRKKVSVEGKHKKQSGGCLLYTSTACNVDFMVVSSYGQGTKTSGEVQIIKDIGQKIEGRDLIIVEDILDSGVTLSYLMR